MKRILFTAMFLVLISSPADNSPVIGSWKCAVPDVPSEYVNSTIILIEKEGKLGGQVKFDSGEEIKLSTVKFTNSQLLITLYVEGYSVTVDGKVSGGKITGTVDIPDGKVNFTAIRIVEQKK